MKVDTAAPTQQFVSLQPDRSGSLRHAAEQFEAPFVGQMLKSVRESASEDSEDDPGANSTFLELAEDQLAQSLAARGGLGIATMVMTGLGKAK